MFDGLYDSPGVTVPMKGYPMQLKSYPKKTTELVDVVSKGGLISP